MKLAKNILNITDPEPILQEEGYWVSDNIFYNLEGVIQDLKGVYNDNPTTRNCIETLSEIQKKIIEIEKLCREALEN